MEGTRKRGDKKILDLRCAGNDMDVGTCIQTRGGGRAVAEWVRALAWAGDRTVSNPATVTSLRNFGNSVYPALPVSFGGDTKSRRSFLSGIYARGSKRSHQSALRPVASNVRLVRPRSCGTMRIIYAKINHSESAGF